jgi:hypothetical protein
MVYSTALWRLRTHGVRGNKAMGRINAGLTPNFLQNQVTANRHFPIAQLVA